MTEHDAPCVHYSGHQPGRCLIGRSAPRDCSDGCAAYNADMLSAMSLHPDERTRCEVWSRVMGCLPGAAPGAPGIQAVHGQNRPVASWNAGKQQEHRDRQPFKEPVQ